MALLILRRHDGQTWREALKAAWERSVATSVGMRLIHPPTRDFDLALSAERSDGSDPDGPSDDEIKARIAFRVAADHGLLERVEDVTDLPEGCDVAVAPEGA